MAELAGREVGCERRDQVVGEERHPHEGRKARDLVADRAHDCLLALAARQVVLGGVESVLANARVDECAASAHRLLAGGEAPPVPSLTLLLGCERTVEAVREDRLGHVDRDAAERVDQLLEVPEVDDHQVVDLEPGEALDRLHGEVRAAELERGVDLREAVAGHVDAQVARDRQERGAASSRVGADEHDRVRALSALSSRPGAVVGPEEQRGRGIRDQQPALLVEGGDRPEATVRTVERPGQREVAREAPDEREEQDEDDRDADSPGPTPTPRRPR